jgi:glycosyltransferase involved in cell wall biosynthesis
MKILLLGEYSNLHWTLAEGLRKLGHDVVVASDGDAWKNYSRDIDLKRHSTGKLDSLKFILKLAKSLPRLKGFDIVQIINPVFIPLKAERIYPIYNFIRKNNGKMFMGAFGMDYYWVKAGLDCSTFRYSDFNIGSSIRKNSDNDIYIRDWYEGEKGKLNRYVADDCDGIVAGLYEYDASYRPYYSDKLKFIPMPINVDSIEKKSTEKHDKVRFFIGMMKEREAYKGTDIMYRALLKIKEKYPDECDIIKVESVPYHTYQNLMNSSDVLIDQPYSYTPAMNALLAMSKGLVVVSGGEEENYNILGENELRPIINVLPDDEDAFRKLEWIILNKQLLPKLSSDSIEYVNRHHHYIKVAEKYLDFWSKMEKKSK